MFSLACLDMARPMLPLYRQESQHRRASLTSMAEKGAKWLYKVLEACSRSSLCQCAGSSHTRDTLNTITSLLIIAILIVEVIDFQQIWKALAGLSRPMCSWQHTALAMHRHHSCKIAVRYAVQPAAA